MKARKRGTNDPFEEIDYIQFKDRYDIYPVCMIEFENESEGNKPDVEYWEQLRHQAAIAAMGQLIGMGRDDGYKYSPSEVANYAVVYTDELIEQLNKK